jgi:hypothetical protein
MLLVEWRTCIRLLANHEQPDPLGMYGLVVW